MAIERGYPETYFNVGNNQSPAGYRVVSTNPVQAQYLEPSYSTPDLPLKVSIAALAIGCVALGLIIAWMVSRR